MTTETLARLQARPAGTRRPRQRGQIAAQLFLIAASVLWLLPILFALYIALRPYSETQKYGYVSLPRHLTLTNFADAWNQ